MKEREIVLNGCYGGFGISEAAKKWLSERGMTKEQIEDTDRHWPTNEARMNPLLIKCIKTLGKEANGNHADLRIETFTGNKIRIDEYDGIEQLRTPETERYDTV